MIFTHVTVVSEIERVRFLIQTYEILNIIWADFGVKCLLYTYGDLILVNDNFLFIRFKFNSHKSIMKDVNHVNCLV